MPRLPSDVWRHFTQIDVNGKSMWTCKYCSRSYVKNATKLQLHLLKCQPFFQASVQEAGTSTSVETHQVLGNLLVAPGNSGTLFDYYDSVDEHSRRNADECFARALYATNSPLTLASNVYWKRFFNILHYNPPTAHALSSHLLDEEYGRVQATVKQAIDKVECISVISEGWSSVQGIVNYTLTTPQAFFYKSTDIKDYMLSGAYIAEELKNVIEEVGPEKVLALVTDSAANMEEAWERMEQTYPHILTIGCAAHSLSLLLKDIMKLRSIDMLYQKVKHILTFVKGNQAALAFCISKQKQKEKSMELKLPSNARGGAVFMFESLLDGQESLQEMALSQSLEIESEMQRILLDNVFWEKLSSGLSILKPIANAMAKIEDDDAVLSDVVSLFSALKEEMQTVLPTSLLLSAEEAAALDLMEKHRKFCQKPLHAAAFMLDPKYDGGVLSGEEVSSAYGVITTLSDHLGLDSGKVLGSLAKYRTKQGLWSEGSLWQSRKHISACTWWNGLCESEAITPVASTILQIPPSAVSLRWKAQAKVCCRLMNGREEKLAAVQANLRLFEADTEPSSTRLDSDSGEEEEQVMDNTDWS